MGIADRDLFDLTLKPFAFDVILHRKRLADQQQDTGEEVFEHILEGETDGDTAHTQGGQRLAGGDCGKGDGHRDQHPEEPHAHHDQHHDHVDKRPPHMGAAQGAGHNGLNDADDGPEKTQENDRQDKLRQDAPEPDGVAF